MTGINHALTGALIVSAVNPVIGLPLAFVSHFALDALPHFGQDFGERKSLSKGVWLIDTVLLLLLLTGLIISSNWLLILGGFVAFSPDFAWIYRFVVDEKFGSLPPKPANRLNTLHADIQKFATIKGIFVEIVWLVLFTIMLITII